MNSSLPVVTVVITCYNHGKFVKEAIHSVLSQTYPQIQLIVTDNASADNSVDEILPLANEKGFLFIQNKVNLGICKAFNAAIEYSEGKYLIDLSADDILLPEKVKMQVERFESLDESYGMLYSNIEYISESGKVTGSSVGKKNYPSGRIFKEVLREYIIPSPSTIFKKSAFIACGKYNEKLAFEDFDFWVRCCHMFKVDFLPDITTRKRVLKNSLSARFRTSESDRMLRSTLHTYQWASEKLKDHAERQAFNEGASYFFRQCVLHGHVSLAQDFLNLMDRPTGFKNYLALAVLKFKTRFKS